MHAKALQKLHTFLQDDHGATAVEYSMMLVLIILVVYLAVGYLGQGTEQSFNRFASTFNR